MPDYDHNGPVPRIPQPPVGSTRATCGRYVVRHTFPVFRQFNSCALQAAQGRVLVEWVLAVLWQAVPMRILVMNGHATASTPIDSGRRR